MTRKIFWKVTRKGDWLISRVTDVSFNNDDASTKLDEKGTRVVEITVGVHDFKVLKARVVLGNVTKDIDWLDGIEAYFQGKKKFKAEAIEHGFINEATLFVQTISALIQAETYVYKERGYKSKEEYNTYWDRIEENGCRMYSDQFREYRKQDLPWLDYVPDNFSKEEIFFREKTYEYGKNKCRCKLKDTYHEMEVNIFFNEEKIIKDMEIIFLRAPGVACFFNEKNADNLYEYKIGDNHKRIVIEKMGGAGGCYHIVELIIEAFSVIKGSNEP